MIYDRKHWLKSYDPDVKAECDIPDVSLKDYLLDTFRQFSDRAAYYYFGYSQTYGDLIEMSGRFATFLQKQGLGKGDVVAVNLPNTPQYLICIVGALRAGCAISGLAPLLMPDEMAYQLNDCGARVLVSLDLLFDGKYVRVADKTTGVEHVLVTGATDPLPNVTQYPVGQPLAGKQVSSLYSVLENYPNEAPDIALTKDDACFLQYTGGTTGPPKGAVLTHGSMVANVYQFEDWMKMVRGQEVWLSGFPMFHQAGLFVSACALAWAATQCLVPDPRNVDHIVGQIKAHQPTFLINVPSLFGMLLANENFRNLDFSNVRYCMSGAAPFPVDTIKALEKVVGEGKMVEVWGMTETSPLITVNPGRGRKKIGSVGLPLPGTEFRVVSLNDGETEVPIGTEGELICSGPQVMKGYLNKPAETEHALRTHDGRTWMHTGDVGRMDEDGFVYVVDRAKDMIIVGGYKVFSSEVEDKFYQHPAISLCALIGLPNPERPESEIVKLFVQKSEAYQDKPDDEVREELDAFARSMLSPYKVPKQYEFVPAIPMTSVGKIDKKSLRK